jgi:hypothetical protein
LDLDIVTNQNLLLRERRRTPASSSSASLATESLEEVVEGEIGSKAPGTAKPSSSAGSAKSTKTPSSTEGATGTCEWVSTWAWAASLGEGCVSVLVKCRSLLCI